MGQTSSSFRELSEVASVGCGGQIVFATDDWFAPAEWMLRDSEPVFVPDAYTACGKLMDGWETRRKRIAGHDWCLIRLGAPTTVIGVTVDTAFFTGNFAPRFSIQAGSLTVQQETTLSERSREGDGMMGSCCSEADLEAVGQLETEQWPMVIAMTELKPGYEASGRQYFRVRKPLAQAVTHLRVNIFPDGGIARLRVYGVVERILDDPTVELDLVAMRNGGRCLGFSNAHYGHPRNLIKPSDGENMGDGWETARRLDRPAILQTDESGMLQVPGSEWAIFQLGVPGTVERIVIDTSHFKGNFPDSVQLEYSIVGDHRWRTLLQSRKLGPDRRHEFTATDLAPQGPSACNRIRVTISPDGGLSRMRIFGRIVQ